MGIRDFFRSGAWRPWLKAGGVRLGIFIVAGLLWFTPLSWLMLLYPEVWLSDLRVASLVSRITGAVWLPTDGDVSLGLGALIFPLIVADTVIVGYVAWAVRQAVRHRRQTR